METKFDKKISRRNFINTSAKVLAACSMFGIFSSAEAAKKIKVEEKFPVVKKFQTLEEMDIGRKDLQFGEMTLRDYTGAIVIHHSGLLIGDIDSKLEDIHKMHIERNHWSGIGYHFLVHKDGAIEYARPLEYRGAHTFNNNEFTVGICLTGNYQFGQPPASQLQSAVQLIGALCDKYDFEPTDTTIFGHRDLGKTTCPGVNLYNLLPEIIQSSQKLLQLS